MLKMGMSKVDIFLKEKKVIKRTYLMIVLTLVLLASPIVATTPLRPILMIEVGDEPEIF